VYPRTTMAKRKKGIKHYSESETPKSNGGGGRVINFSDVTYEHNPKTKILTDANFSMRRGSKMTLMGQNGAGKSTIFKLITGELKPEEGSINIAQNVSMAISRQVIPQEQMDLTMREFFEAVFDEKIYNIDPKIDEVLKVVNLGSTDKEISKQLKERTMRAFSGGQQARLLLASALIQNPDVLLLDEPTNNLDHEGIMHLTAFLKDYNKTVLVISHDADFLNSFTEGVLYLNTQTRTVEQYDGNYRRVVRDIEARVHKEKRKNAQLEKEIQANKDKANAFANKGGNMRAIAKKMREKVEEHEENKIDVRKEDKTIKKFTIPAQQTMLRVLQLSSYKVIIDHAPKDVACNVEYKRGDHVQIVGPNGIGKTTLLESLASGHAEGQTIAEDVRIGYYRQDFSNLDFDQTVIQCLQEASEKKSYQEIRAIAAGFLLTGDIVNSKIGVLSEGQKGLVAFARLVLLEPGLLILDEPTNHINFRHIPMIAQALDAFEGTMLLVSHVPEFVDQIRIDEVLDLGKKKK